MNPYRNTNFFTFFIELAHRLFTGGGSLASDELQILVLAGVSCSAAIVGTFLLYRKNVMLANSLSHTILLGVVVTYMITSMNLPAMFLAACLTGMVTTFLTETLTRFVRLQEDAANGLVFSTLFALGIVLVTLFTRNAHIGVELVMGNVDALHPADLKLVYSVVALNIGITFPLFRAYRTATFDPGFSRSIGLPTFILHYLLMVQVSATVIGGFRAVGVLMILALITAPAMIAKRFTKTLSKMIFLACGIGIGASILGVATARHILTLYDIPLSTAGLIVCYLVGTYALTLLFKPQIRYNPTS